MRYGSVCSGIEAASVAWHPLGWEPQWFSEIEAFPSKVLNHRFPQVPNLGDMTKLTDNDTFNERPIDLLVGGTPCQSFSVAGLRRGLDDERGNLSLEYVRLLMRKQPRWFLWENVPGVLSSSNGADFASILSAWTGRDIAVQKFGTAGLIQGEFYSIAWRVLDSRHFGVPQRRRRVFVVGHLGNDWRPSAAVLFERESLLRDLTPGGKKRKGTTAGVDGSISCESNGISGAVTKKWAKGTGGPAGDEHYNMVLQPVIYDTTQVTSPVNGSNPQPGDPCHPLCKGGHVPLLVPPAYGLQANIIDRTHKSGGNGLGVKEEEAPTLTKADRHAVYAAQQLIRRLTPLECERLQGFPDGWTNIPGASDSNRYAALGNSMTVNVMRWIGSRIDLTDQLLKLI